MNVALDEGRAAFLEALDALVDAARGLDDKELLAASRCRGWTVGDVLVHVHMGLQEMLLGVVSPTGAAPDVDAATYWQQDLPSNDAEADDVAGVRFVRLVGAAYRRPTGLVNHFTPTAAGVARAVSSMGEHNVAFQGHVLTPGDFLATWAVELAVHHLDLGAELALAAPAATAMRLARATIEALSGELPATWTDETAVLVGTGRLALTDAQAEQAGDSARRLPALG